MLHPTKIHTLRFTSRAKKRETEPDIFMAGERVDTPDTTVHLGIVRNTDGRADIDGKISLGRKTAYSLMGAGLHWVGGLKATLGGHIWSTFVIPRLLYGLEALLIKQKDIDSLEKFQRKYLYKVQGIPENTSNSACLALMGILPIKDILNKNLPNLFVNMIRDESSIEYEIARRQMVMKDSPSESIFTDIQSILRHFELPSVFELLSNPPSRETWKRLLNCRVHDMVEAAWKADIESKSSTKYLNLFVLNVGSSHHIWSTSKVSSLWTDSDDSDDSVILLDPVPNTCSSVKKPDFPVVKVSSTKSKVTSLWTDSDDSDDSVILLDPVPNTCSSVKKPDFPVVKVSSTKKATQWVASSFDGFGELGVPSNKEPKSKPLSQKARLNNDTSTISGRNPRPEASGVKRTFESLKQEEKERSSNGFGRKTVTRRANKLPETDLWSDKYTPKSQSELAVHKKKLTEVESWIKEHINTSRKSPPILLLTGPSGAGKTATVKVLAKELGCQLQEWANPLADSHNTNWNTDDWKSRSRLDQATSGSQQSQFQDFLLRANKYNTLDIFGDTVSSKKIIFVEDFPNVFYKDASLFHQILRRYVQVGGNPLIFIISDSTRGESNERLLFPKDIQQQLAVQNISFNPIAMTSLTKILTKIATEESQKGSHKFNIPSKTVIESIAMSSAGDVRGAINALQFACLKDTVDLCDPAGYRSKATLKKRSSSSAKTSKPTKAGSSSKSTKQEDSMAAIGGRDTSIFLFRALGKILYCKRDEPDSDVESKYLPGRLSHHYRDPLQVNPEEVVERSHLSGDFFNAYLHQNYLEFFSSIEDIVSASDYLSDADYLTIDWASRSVLQQYAASVATRGIMHSNTARARHNATGGSLGWKPLHKPQCYSISKLARQNCETARFLFKSYRSAPEVLQTELIPFISLINTTLHDTGQISFVQEMCRFSRYKTSSGSEKLDEKDIDVEEEDVLDKQLTNQIPGQSQLPLETDDVISNSQSNLKTSQEEEEYEIEDYDD